jgi:hypothetical protein
VLVINCSDVVSSLTLVGLSVVENSEVDDESVINSSEVWLIDKSEAKVLDEKLISFVNVFVIEVKYVVSRLVLVGSSGLVVNSELVKTEVEVVVVVGTS